MITFRIRNIYRAYPDNRQLESDYLNAIANTECDFGLTVKSETLLKEKHWNLVEFVEQLLKWKSNGMDNSFIYDCMDSEEVLFTVRKEGEEFRMFSNTELIKESELLTRTKIEDFIERLKIETIQKIKQQFKIDLTTINELEIK